MKTFLASILVLLFVTSAQAAHKDSHNPPGQTKKQLTPVCDCLAVEVRKSVFRNKDIIHPNLELVISGILIQGNLECVGRPDRQDRGEASFRAILSVLSWMQDEDRAIMQSLCPR